MVMPAGTARAEDPLGQATSAVGVPTAFIHQQAECDPSHDKWTTLTGYPQTFSTVKNHPYKGGF
ncbi:hypothetical protein [Halobacillus kuroshimensis]|uniref:hypothetical protein n=1 Tax=Halobacillus kuroshimensis TaxID=302481 RepID=UPI0012EB9376|nr:hypothetical protein [Halobacillus kuroshimensis]